MLNRRSLITGLVSLIAAPAIVRATSLMPVRAWAEDVYTLGVDLGHTDYTVIAIAHRVEGKFDVVALGEAGKIEMSLCRPYMDIGDIIRVQEAITRRYEQSARESSTLARPSRLYRLENLEDD